MTRPPGRRGGGGRAPKVRSTGGRGGRSGGGSKSGGCLALVFAGSTLMLTSGAAGLALAVMR